MKRRFFLLIAVLLSHPGQADNTTSTGSTTVVQSQSQTLQQQAGTWMLSTDEYQRYQALMDGPRGIQSPGLDPLSALGIEARDPAERRKYAEQWVRQEFVRAQKELEFQREIDAAWQRIYADQLPVNLHPSGVIADKNTRLALFVKARDCRQCDRRLAAILADNRPVDIYLVDSQGHDEVLRQWAQDQRIPADRVRNRQITLNHDNGRWLLIGNGLMPVLLQQGGQGWQVVAF